MLLPHIKLYLEKRGLELPSLPHFQHDFSRKNFLTLYSINRPNLSAWLSFLTEIMLRYWVMVLGKLLPRKIAPNPKLTLTQTLTLSGGQFSSGAIVWLLPNPKTKPNLNSNPNPNRGGNFSREAIVRITWVGSR